MGRPSEDCGDILQLFQRSAPSGPGGYFSTVDGNPFGDSNGADILFAIFSSPMIIAFLAAFILDNTVKGTREERGLHVWDKIKVWNDCVLSNLKAWRCSAPLTRSDSFCLRLSLPILTTTPSTWIRIHFQSVWPKFFATAATWSTQLWEDSPIHQ